MSVIAMPQGGYKAHVKARDPHDQVIEARRQSRRWTRREAERWERDTRRRIEAGEWGRKEAEPTVVVPTLEEYWPAYLQDGKDEQQKPSTLKSKGSM